MSKIISVKEVSVGVWRVVVDSGDGVYGTWSLQVTAPTEQEARDAAAKAATLVDRGVWSRDDARAWA